MTIKYVITCDGCGREHVLHSDAQPWHGMLTIKDGRDHATGVERHFCGTLCVIKQGVEPIQRATESRPPRMTALMPPETR